MAFGGNTRDLGSFGEETNEITDLHQILEELLLTERGDGVAGIKRRRRDPSGDGVRDLVTAETNPSSCSSFIGDENHIRTLGDYSKHSHEVYRNTIELPVGNNVVPLRSNTIRLVQNGCSFHGLRSEDPNQHLKDFLKLVDLLDLDGENRERTRLRRTAKLSNDILMFQQHHVESLSEAWTHFKDLLQKVPHYGIDRWLQIQFFYDHVSFHLKCEIDRAAGGKLPHTELMERFKNVIFKQREEINDRMTKMFGLLKELMTSRASEKVLIREEAKFPVTKNVNSISLTRGEEEKSKRTDVNDDDIEKPTKTETKMLVKEAEKEDEAESEPNRKARKEEAT
ncbi:hypothetical protein Tco_1430000 [Tanacetum coccineum]